MARVMYNFISNCWGWIPTQVFGLLAAFILIAFGDSVLGLVDRAWRVIGK